jgi:CBS domain-containing protein
MRVADILKAKGSTVLTVRPNETIQAVAKRLKQENVGAMIVSNDGVSLEGVISERDVALSIALFNAEFHALPASALMQSTFATCSPDSSVVDIAKLMTEKRLRHLPVKQNGRLVGVISIGDVLKHRLAEVQLEARVLQDIAIARR